MDMDVNMGNANGGGNNLSNSLMTSSVGQSTAVLGLPDLQDKVLKAIQVSKCFLTVPLCSIFQRLSFLLMFLNFSYF